MVGLDEVTGGSGSDNGWAVDVVQRQPPHRCPDSARDDDCFPHRAERWFAISPYLTLLPAVLAESLGSTAAGNRKERAEFTKGGTLATQLACPWVAPGPAHGVQHSCGA
eukprot:gene2023-biopygen379